MKKTISATIAVASIAANAQTNWKIDNSHSKSGFSVTHMMVSEVEGQFKVYGGEVESKTETDFTDATITFTLDVNSINTDDTKRDDHLKSVDFFDATKYPTIAFKATSMKPGKVKDEYILSGDLTMKGVTKKVTLKAVSSGKTMKDPWGNTRYGFKVSGDIKRSDFGLTWNKVLEGGGFLVSDKVEIKCSMELVKQ